MDFVNANIDEAAELVGKYEIVPAAVAQKAIPACNITFIAGGEMKPVSYTHLTENKESNRTYEKHPSRDAYAAGSA